VGELREVKSDEERDGKREGEEGGEGGERERGGEGGGGGGGGEGEGVEGGDEGQAAGRIFHKPRAVSRPQPVLPPPPNGQTLFTLTPSPPQEARRSQHVLSLLDLYARKLQQAERDNAAHIEALQDGGPGESD